MQDYATGNAAATQRPATPLDSLATAVQRVNTANVNVGRFLDRFHGPTPQEAPDTKLDAPMHHSGNLDRLFAALDRLETRVDALNAIG